MTDRCTVADFFVLEATRDPSLASRLEWFAAGVESIEREHPKAPRRFRPFEWRRGFETALALAAEQGITVS